MMRRRREEFENAATSFNSKAQFILELKVRQKEQLEQRGKELQAKIDATKVSAVHCSGSVVFVKAWCVTVCESVTVEHLPVLRGRC
jgi:hypothetical protein